MCIRDRSQPMVLVHRCPDCDWTGRAARSRAWPRQDNCCRLSGRLQRNRTSRGASRRHRHRIAHSRCLRPRRDHLIRFAVHRSRAALSLAWRILRHHHRRPRHLYAFAPLDRHGYGTLSSTGRRPQSFSFSATVSFSCAAARTHSRRLWRDQS